MLTEPARQALLELRQDSDGTGYVFRNASGLVQDRNHLRHNFNAAVERAALPETDDGRSSSTRCDIPGSPVSPTAPRSRS
jgi:hypothetical protein